MTLGSRFLDFKRKYLLSTKFSDWLGEQNEIFCMKVQNFSSYPFSYQEGSSSETEMFLLLQPSHPECTLSRWRFSLYLTISCFLSSALWFPSFLLTVLIERPGIWKSINCGKKKNIWPPLVDFILLNLTFWILRKKRPFTEELTMHFLYHVFFSLLLYCCVNISLAGMQTCLGHTDPVL